MTICAFEGCSRDFTAKTPVQKYCSKYHCEQASRLRRAVVTRCASCDEEFLALDPRQRFCSRSCSASSTQSGRTRRSRKTCPVCGNLFLSGYATCSSQCMGRQARTENAARWFARCEEVEVPHGRLPNGVRGFLLDEAGWECTKCGWSVPNPVTKKPILTINHIDGNWQNNRRSNLELICYNCHTLTPTFGALNQGSGSGKRSGAGSRARK